MNKNFKDEFFQQEQKEYGNSTASHINQFADPEEANLVEFNRLNFDYSTLDRSLIGKIESDNRLKMARENRRNLIIGALIFSIPILFGRLLNDYTAVLLFLVIALYCVFLGTANSSFKSRKKECCDAKENFAIKNGMIYKDEELYYYDFRSTFDRVSGRYPYTGQYRYDVFSGKEFNFGMVHYRTSGKHPTHYHTFYFEKTFPFYVQDLIIDSKNANRIHISEFGNEKLVSLEGDFNEYFTIETEKDRKIEATSFLAPDLMSTLIDEFSGYEIEFFANKVRFYYPSNGFSYIDILEELSFYSRNVSKIQSFFKRFEDKFSLLEMSLEDNIKKEEKSIAGSSKSKYFFIFWISILIINSIILWMMKPPHVSITVLPAMFTLTGLIISGDVISKSTNKKDIILQNIYVGILVFALFCFAFLLTLSTR